MSSTAGGHRNSRGLTRAALELARRWRRVYPHGGFEGHWEPAELQVLLSLGQRPEQSVRELAESLELARPTVSNAARRLLSEKLIRTAPDPEDRRSQLLLITPKGQRLVERFLEQAAPHLSR